VVVQGLELATVKGRDAIPGQQLALSTALRRGTFPEVDVDYATAIAYLRRDAITLPDGTPRGFVLLTYASRPLGFVKNIGSRANNLYPADRRILSTHVPDTPPTVI
jgi:NOL1/NOP2/fmu family ribosome biogenesis protein